jgi:hypothetical protein
MFRVQTLVCRLVIDKANLALKTKTFLLVSPSDSVRLSQMNKIEYTERERWLIDPEPGTAAARARDFGIDLSLTVSNLRLTPEERIRKLDRRTEQLRRAKALAFPDGYDRHLAALLELEAIFEYEQMIAAGKI